MRICAYAGCSKPLVQRGNEEARHFTRRRYCSRECASSVARQVSLTMRSGEKACVPALTRRATAERLAALSEPQQRALAEFERLLDASIRLELPRADAIEAAMRSVRLHGARVEVSA